MKLSLIVVGSLCIAAQSAATVPAKRPEDVCPRPRSEVPLYRAYNAKLVDHFYTTKTKALDEAVPFGLISEGIAGYIFATQEASTVPLFQLFNPALVDHFYTTQPSEVIQFANSGWIRQGILGYIFDKQVCGSQPLFRLFNTSSVDHFYTANWEERNNAINVLQYKEEPVAGYIIG